MSYDVGLVRLFTGKNDTILTERDTIGYTTPLVKEKSPENSTSLLMMPLYVVGAGSQSELTNYQWWENRIQDRRNVLRMVYHKSTTHLFSC